MGMDDKISNHRLPLMQTYYLPVHIDKLEKVLMNTNEDMTSFPCILVVSNGSVLLTLNGHQYTLSRGSVVLWDDYNDVKLTAQTHTTLQGTLIQYRSLTNDGTKPHVFKHHEPLRDCSLKILTLTEELESVSRRPTSSKPFYFQQLFLELLAELYEELEGRLQQINVWMEQVLHYIDYHFHEDLTREQIAEMAQVSPEHFSRTFRKHTGQTFSNYLALLRIRAQFGARGTAIVWEMNTNSAYCINSSYGRGSQILYQDLGFQVPNQILEEGIEVHGYLEKEIEAIAYYAADHIFITSLPSNPMAKKRINRLFQSEPWLKMEAIQQKRVYLIDQPNLFYGYDPLSSKAQLRELMRVLTS